MLEFKDYIGNEYSTFGNHYFHEGYVTVRNIHGKYGFIDKKVREKISK